MYQKPNTRTWQRPRGFQVAEGGNVGLSFPSLGFTPVPFVIGESERRLLPDKVTLRVCAVERGDFAANPWIAYQGCERILLSQGRPVDEMDPLYVNRVGYVALTLEEGPLHALGWRFMGAAVFRKTFQTRTSDWSVHGDGPVVLSPYGGVCPDPLTEFDTVGQTYVHLDGVDGQTRVHLNDRASLGGVGLVPPQPGSAHGRDFVFEGCAKGTSLGDDLRAGSWTLSVTDGEEILVLRSIGYEGMEVIFVTSENF